MTLPENGPKRSKRKFHLKQPLFFLCEVVVLGRVSFKTQDSEFSGIPNARYFLVREGVPDGIPPKTGSIGKPLTFGLVSV